MAKAKVGATAGRAKAHIDRTLFIVRTPDFPLLLRCLTVCCDLATINAMTSHSTENVDELLKFPLWRKCCKRGSKSREPEEARRKAGERGARPQCRARPRGTSPPRAAQQKKNPTPVRMLGS